MVRWRRVQELPSAQHRAAVVARFSREFGCPVDYRPGFQTLCHGFPNHPSLYYPCLLRFPLNWP